MYSYRRPQGQPRLHEWQVGRLEKVSGHRCLFYTFLAVDAYAHWYTHATGYMWRSKGNLLQESLLSFRLVGPRDWWKMPGLVAGVFTPLISSALFTILFRTNNMRVSTLVGSGEEDEYRTKYNESFWAITSGFYMPLKWMAKTHFGVGMKTWCFLKGSIGFTVGLGTF